MEETLELGDIIQIIASENEALHNMVCLVSYIDEQQIEVIKENKDTYVIFMENHDIEEINLLSRSDVKGYAKQNNLLINTWIDIHFSGEFPFILTGQIKNQIEDRITVQIVHPIQEEIYIDFAYKGLPKYTDITRIEIRDAPQNIIPQPENGEEGVPEGDPDFQEDELFDDDDFMFDGEQEVIRQLFEADEEHRRFHIQTQKEDLLNDMLSKIPSSERTQKTLKHIHKTIDRFEQLRNMYSAYDSNKYISGIKRIDNIHPLTHHILSGTNIPSWILPVVENKMNIYKQSDEPIFEDVDINVLPMNEENTNMESIMYDTDRDSFHHQILNNEVYLDNMDNAILMKTVACKEDDIMISIASHYKTKYIHENASIRALVTLPESHMLHEIDENPSSSILSKLHTHLPNYDYSFKEWMNEDVFIHPELSSYHDIPLDIRNNTDIPSRDRYETYLQEKLPNPEALLSYVLPYMKTTRFLSYENIVTLMYFARVLPQDIQLSVYKRLMSIVTSAQNMYERTLRNTSNPRVKSTLKVNTLKKLIEGKDEEDVLSLYTQDRDSNMTSEELYIRMLKDDYGYAFFSSISKMNIDLIHSNIDLKQALEMKLKALEDNKPDKNQVCKPMFLTKTYLSIEDLQRDNNNPDIYVDGKYDETRYEIIDEFKMKEDTMSAEDFYSFLVNHLRQMVGLDQDIAKIEARALIERKRRVYEGDYAILSIRDDPSIYYKRVNDVWTLDDTMTEEQEGASFCNSRRECVPVDNSCYHLDNLKFAIEEKETNSILKEIVQEEGVNIQQIKENIIRSNLDSKKELRETQFIREANNMRYDRYRRSIMVSETEVLELSPFEQVKSSMFSLPFKRKMEVMDLFIQKATKKSVLLDDPWLYCVKTDIPLLPSFYVSLLAAYRKGTYSQELDSICASRGVLSDDGDKWVDKYTGYVIKNIEFNSEYQSNPEDDLQINMDYDSVTEKNKYSTPEFMFSDNVLQFFSKSMGITALDGKYTKIIQEANEIMNRITNFESFHKRMSEKYKSWSTKKIKKKFEEQKYTNLLLCTGILYLIYVQTAIPSISMKRAYPGCKKSLSGYPSVMNGDMKGIEYIACIMKNASVSTKDGTYWFVIKKMSLDGIVKHMKTIYEKQLHSRKTIQIMIQKKLKYNKQNEEKEVIEDNTSEWNTFVPSLKQNQQIKTISMLKKEFFENLSREIKQSRIQQHGTLQQLEHHISLLSQRIHDVLFQIIQREQLLLGTNNNEPYIENACCNKRDSIWTKEKNVNDILEIIKRETLILSTYKRLVQGPYLVLEDNENNDDEERDFIFFHKELIHQMYYIFCKKHIISNTICDEYNEEEEDFSTFLLRTRRDVNKTDVIQIYKEYLYRTLPERNIIVNDAYSWRKSIEIDMDKEDPILSYITSSNEKDVLNTILTVNSEHLQELIDFLKTYIRRNDTTAIRNVHSFLENGFYFSKYDPNDIKPDQSAKISSFYKYAIEYICSICPSYAKEEHNEEYMKHYVPEHWGLSSFHKMDIMNILKRPKGQLNSWKDPVARQIYDNKIMEKLNMYYNVSRKLPYYWSESPRRLIEIYRFILLDSCIAIIDNKSLVDTEEADEIDTMEQKNILEKIAEMYIVQWIEIYTQFKVIDVDAYENSQRILRMRDDEKNRKLREFQKMTREEKVVDNMLKGDKLGKYSVGFQKGFREYDPEFYDMERSEIFREIREDGDKLSELSRRNRELYQFEDSELLQQEEEDNEMVMGDDDEEIEEA